MVNTYFRGQSLGGNSAGRQSGSGGAARVVERTAHEQEPRARAVSPAAVSQMGGHRGDHATESGKMLPGGGKSLYARPGLNNVGPTPCGEGPGAGRVFVSDGGHGHDRKFERIGGQKRERIGRET